LQTKYKNDAQPTGSLGRSLWTRDNTDHADSTRPIQPSCPIYSSSSQVAENSQLRRLTFQEQEIFWIHSAGWYPESRQVCWKVQWKLSCRRISSKQLSQNRFVWKGPTLVFAPSYRKVSSLGEKGCCSMSSHGLQRHRWLKNLKLYLVNDLSQKKAKGADTHGLLDQ
jgi:hypothetical protein